MEKFTVTLHCTGGRNFETVTYTVDAVGKDDAKFVAYAMAANAGIVTPESTVGFTISVRMAPTCSDCHLTIDRLSDVGDGSTFADMWHATCRGYAYVRCSFVDGKQGETIVEHYLTARGAADAIRGAIDMANIPENRPYYTVEAPNAVTYPNAFVTFLGKRAETGQAVMRTWQIRAWNRGFDVES